MQLLLSLVLLTTSVIAFTEAFSHSNIFPIRIFPSSRTRILSTLFAGNNEVIAVLAGPAPSSSKEKEDVLSALESVRLFTSVIVERNDEIDINKVINLDFSANNDSSDYVIVHKYKFVKATGMLKLIESIFPDSNQAEKEIPPQWIPIQNCEEKFLVKRGWSFLDPDESEPVSAFDVDAANKEGLYIPKWDTKDQNPSSNHNDKDKLQLSSLGFDLSQPSYDEIKRISLQIESHTREVLLHGKTDPPGIKRTQNGFDFSGSVDRAIIPKGVFFNPITNLPLFSTTNLSPTTASSGWLTFSQPIAQDHVELIFPTVNATDSRIEVVCAKTKCHLGHYFGEGEGFCINAGALNFIPFAHLTREQNSKQKNGHVSSSMIMFPTSWRSFDMMGDNQQLYEQSKTILHSILFSHCETEMISFGAGCFWHTEYALRRLPGILSTRVGYAGFNGPKDPTYEQVCKGNTGYAEVVQVVFDPNICEPRALIDCFLSLHDPTKVRAHGKHEAKVGQYRSCLFTTSTKIKNVAIQALEDCQLQLEKKLSTEIYFIEPFHKNWFWEAEDRHQLHDQRQNNRFDVNTLSFNEWIKKYGKRTKSILGSSETFVPKDDINAIARLRSETGGTEEDDGMARLMI